MAKETNSSEVCMLLARQLIEEQAEVVKHQGVVNGISSAIFRKKAEIIWNRIKKRRMYRREGKKFMVTEVSLITQDNGMLATLAIAYEPVSLVVGRYNLSEREKELVVKYLDIFRKFKDDPDYDFSAESSHSVDISDIASKLQELENGIKLVDMIRQKIDFSDAVNPEFYNTSGISYAYDESTLQYLMI